MVTSATPLVLDGSQLEGGGQLVRNAVALAALLGIPLHLFNIRAGRPQSGLRAQHCKGIELVSQLCVSGVEVQQPVSVGDMELHLNSISTSCSKVSRPCHLRMHADTAASVCLMLQSALPCALFGQKPVLLELGGGTDVPFAPTVNYMENVFLSVLERFMNIECSLKVHRRGMFPRGGGLVQVCINPTQHSLPSLEMLHRGSIQRIRGTCYACGRFPEEVAANMTKSTERLLKEKVGDIFQVSSDVSIDVQLKKGSAELHCADNGCVLSLVAESSNGNRFGGSSIVHRKNTVKAINEAVQQLMNSLSINICVDQFTQDQLIVFMALAEGTSRIRCGQLTLHTRTAISVAQQLTDAVFKVQPLDDGQLILSVDGIGYRFASS